MNSRNISKAVIDVAPWPDGLGFEDTTTWWAYVLSQPEKDRIDFLMATALLSAEVASLLLKHDHDLLDRFELSEQTKTLFSGIEAKTLNEFARAVILKRSSP